YDLTSNPTIYDSLVKQFWQSATANTLANGTLELQATIDTIVYTITEASIRTKLQLEDALGITMLPNNEIFEGMGNMGSKSGGSDQFGSNIATALICLSTGIQNKVFDVSSFSATNFGYSNGKQTPLSGCDPDQKIFRNMKRGFRGAPRPLLPAMLLVAITNPNTGKEHHVVAQSQPSSSTLPVPSTSSPPVQSPPPIPTPIPTPIPASIPTPTPIPKTEPKPIGHTFEEPSPAHQHFSPSQGQAQGQMTMDDLL
ncbi:hypothetical protein Tco_1187758, partial [Tanacetum coccineum]